MTLLVDASVLATFGTWTARFEGRVRTLYLDVKGLPTVGLGCLCKPLSVALALPWLRADGTAATQAEIADEWDRVCAMPPGLAWTSYRSASAGLHLSDAAIDALAAQRVQADAVVLARAFPDLATYPPQVQRALLSIAWACGAGWPATWPHLSAAVRARDWTAAADNCAIDATGNPGVVPRNTANRALFLEAAEAEAPTGALTAELREPKLPAGADPASPMAPADSVPAEADTQEGATFDATDTLPTGAPAGTEPS